MKPPPLTNDVLAALARVIHQSCGLVVGQDKAYLIRHRLEPVLCEHGLSTFEQLLQRLRGAAGASLLATVIDAITTQETQFFRDGALFDAIRDVVLPERVAALRQSGDPRRQLRIWSAAASTGQEIYSVAMLVRELLASPAASGVGASAFAFAFALLASDISTRAIATARAGRYTDAEVKRGLSDARLRRYFRADTGQWQLAESIREMVRFRCFNLMDAPSGQGLFDLILCRNVLIYFDEPTRERVCKGIMRVLRPGAWLALGAAESLYGIEGHGELVKVGGAVLYRAPQG